jgi:hypothetical protein
VTLSEATTWLSGYWGAALWHLATAKGRYQQQHRLRVLSVAAIDRIVRPKPNVITLGGVFGKTDYSWASHMRRKWREMATGDEFDRAAHTAWSAAINNYAPGDVVPRYAEVWQWTLEASVNGYRADVPPDAVWFSSDSPRMQPRCVVSRPIEVVPVNAQSDDAESAERTATRLLKLADRFRLVFGIDDLYHDAVSGIRRDEAKRVLCMMAAMMHGAISPSPTLKQIGSALWVNDVAEIRLALRRWSEPIKQPQAWRDAWIACIDDVAAGGELEVPDSVWESLGVTA